MCVRVSINLLIYRSIYRCKEEDIYRTCIIYQSALAPWFMLKLKKDSYLIFFKLNSIKL